MLTELLFETVMELEFEFDGENEGVPEFEVVMDVEMELEGVSVGFEQYLKKLCCFRSQQPRETQ